MTKRRPEVSPASNPGKPGHACKADHTLADAAEPVTPQGLKRRHFMGTALALDAAALLAACGGGGGGGDSGSNNTSGTSSGSSSASSSASSSPGSSSSSSASSSSSSSGSGSGSVSAAPTNWVVSTLPGLVSASGGSALQYYLFGVAVDTNGNVFVADKNNNRIRKITPAGVASTLAGTGTAGADNGAGTTATFNTPAGIALDGSGNVYVADTGNNRIRKINSAGVVSTLAGEGNIGLVNGTAATARFISPHGIALDGSGNVYVADAASNLIRKISSAGVVSTLAGGGGVVGGGTYQLVNGTGTAAAFAYPNGITIDGTGAIYVADNGNHVIRKISPAGVVSTFAGMGSAGYVDGSSGTAQFNYPSDVALDNNGNLYVTDVYNHVVRKISASGVVSTVAGTVGQTGSTDGSGGTAKFNHPGGIAVDNSGNLYVAEQTTTNIRKITPIY